MKKSPYQVSYIIHRREYDDCAICNGALGDGYFYGYVYSYGNNVHAQRTCKCCADQSLSIAEAKEDGRRFTNIAIGLADGNWNGYRCSCGAVSVVSESKRGDFCIKCSIANRMLTRLQSEHRLIANALRLLRKEIKTQTEGVQA